MDIGDIISALVVLSFVVGPIIEAIRKGGQNKPPSNQPSGQPSNQPRPSTQNRAPQQPTSAPLQPSPRTQTTPSGTVAQPKQGDWQTSNNKPANDLQARLEEARRRIQEQQQQQARERDSRGSMQPASRQPAQQPSQPRPQRAQPQSPQPQSPQPQRAQPSFPQAQPSYTLLGESEPATSSSFPTLNLETSTPLRSTSLQQPATQRLAIKRRRRRPVVQNAQKQPLLALDGDSIQRGIIWKQILDKPRYKQRLQEKKAFPHR